MTKFWGPEGRPPPPANFSIRLASFGPKPCARSLLVGAIRFRLVSERRKRPVVANLGIKASMAEECRRGSTTSNGLQSSGA